MEHAVIASAFRKYWSAETTVEEEKTLAAYFSQPSIAPELEPYRDLFGWYAEEAALTPSPGSGEQDNWKASASRQRTA